MARTGDYLRLVKFSHTIFAMPFAMTAFVYALKFGVAAPLAPREWIVLLAVASALLMISPIRMFSLKFHGFGWQGNALRYLFLLGCAVLLAVLRERAIPVIVALYVTISTLRWLVFRRQER